MAICFAADQLDQPLRFGGFTAGRHAYLTYRNLHDRVSRYITNRPVWIAMHVLSHSCLDCPTDHEVSQNRRAHILYTTDKTETVEARSKET